MNVVSDRHRTILDTFARRFAPPEERTSLNRAIAAVLDRVDELEAEVGSLGRENDRLRDRVAELEAMVRSAMRDDEEAGTNITTREDIDG